MATIVSWTLEHWMNDSERRDAAALAADFNAYAQGCGAADSPTLRLRCADVVAAAILLARAGRPLVDYADTDAELDPKRLATDLDTHGKAQERLRKALKEFEDHCARAHPSDQQNLADLMAPIMERAPELYERLAQLQQARRDKRDSQPGPAKKGDPLKRQDVV